MENAGNNPIQHRLVDIGGRSLSLLEAGKRENRTILFLHGYPESSWAFEEVLLRLKDRYHLLAVDLPGIGKSDAISSSDKRSIAGIMDGLLAALGLGQVAVAGHDIGGMVAYAFLRYFPDRVSKAVIMNTAIPGLFPWEEVKRNPFVWHFAMYAIPDLPETLVTGRQRPLFDYFFDTLSANGSAISERKRQVYVKAYEKPVALATSFDWYRAFPKDEADNAENTPVGIPVLYVKGEQEAGAFRKYTEGLIRGGIGQLESQLIPGSGHFAPEEQPGEVAEVIHRFMVK